VEAAALDLYGNEIVPRLEGESSMVKGKPVVPPETKRVRSFPAPPKGFDAEKATKKDLLRFGVPLRPDPSRVPGLAAIWDRQVRRYRNFEHLKAEITSADPAAEPPVSAFGGLFPRETCGYELTSPDAPITIFSGKWTIPNLSHSPGPHGTVLFRTFFGLGFLDVHVEMSVDQAQNVAARIQVGNSQVNLPVRPGDWIAATLCLNPDAAGTSACFLANETTAQRTSLSIPAGFPPAVTINAGISRGYASHPFNPLARFGTVYFDELSAFTTNGTRLLTDGAATAMVDDGETLARPLRINDFAFKIVHT
jgi:hypothetical protein